MKTRGYRLAVLLAILMACTCALPAQTQTPASTPAANQDSAVAVSGTVVSSSPTTLTVKATDGTYIVFVYDRFTVKPKTIPNGSSVTVVSTPTNEQGLRVATDVTISSQPPAPATTPGAQPPAPKPYESGEAVPVSVRHLEEDVKRQSRRYSMGIRAGAGLDPEVLLVGLQARIGPFFNRGFSFRPSVDFGWGEVTKMFDISLNGVYRLPFTVRSGKWAMFVGAGPALVFSHRNFEEASAGNNGIDFGQFSFHGGLNFLTGVEFRNGLFFEAKTTVYATPHLKLMIGYTF